jgi:hypothetical protein
MCIERLGLTCNARSHSFGYHREIELKRRLRSGAGPTNRSYHLRYNRESSQINGDR